MEHGKNIIKTELSIDDVVQNMGPVVAASFREVMGLFGGKFGVVSSIFSPPRFVCAWVVKFEDTTPE